MLFRNDIKYLRSIEQKKFRQEYGEALIEGSKLINECLESDYKIKNIYFTENFVNKNKSLLEKLNADKIPFKTCSEKDMDRIAPSRNPQGVAATIKLNSTKDKFQLKQKVLYLDGIADPGNMGTLFRTAAWFGIKQILLSSNCVDPWNPKVVRAGSGSHFHLDFQSIEIDQLKNISSNHALIGAVTNGEDLSSFELKRTDLILVLGSEAHGIRNEISAVLDYKITIPGTEIPESLNVAVAGGIIMNFLFAL